MRPVAPSLSALCAAVHLVACGDTSPGRVGTPAQDVPADLPAVGRIVVTPATIDFGATCPTWQRQRTIEVVNEGDGHTEVVALALTDDGAVLAVVFVSDETDKSPGPVSAYRDALVAVKGGDAARVLAHAIVGPEFGCETANYAPRYAELAALTGGADASICAPSFASTLLALGGSAFGWKTTFDLDHAAVPGTVTVTVAGAACTAGWSLAATGRRVQFDTASPCLPDEGEPVVIRYEMVCR